MSGFRKFVSAFLPPRAAEQLGDGQVTDELFRDIYIVPMNSSLGSSLPTILPTAKEGASELRVNVQDCFVDSQTLDRLPGGSTYVGELVRTSSAGYVGTVSENYGSFMRASTVVNRRSSTGEFVTRNPKEFIFNFAFAAGVPVQGEVAAEDMLPKLSSEVPKKSD